MPPALLRVFGIPVELLPDRRFLVEEHDPYPDPAPDRRYVMEKFPATSSPF